MKHIIQLKETDNLNTVMTNLIKEINDDKKVDKRPGQLVIKNPQGKVIKVTTVTGQKNRVEQSFAEDLDINRMLEPMHKKGLLRHSVKFEGEYDDIPAGDFQEAQFIVARGKSMFEQLPSKTRLKFENNPAKFMQFVQNPENIDWLKKNGIVKGLDGIDAQGVNTGYDPEQQIADAEAPAETE